MKPRVSPLKLVRETVRELSGDDLGQAAGGRAIGPSQTPTCYCSSIPCGGLPTVPCAIGSGVICQGVA